MNPLATLLKKVETLLEVVLSSADNPEDRIRALVADLRRRQARGRRALGLSIALEKQLLADLCTAEDECAALEASAKEALAAADEPRAEQAAARLGPARERERERRTRWEEQRDAAVKVRAAVLETARRTGEVAHARSVLLARARCADAMRSIAETLDLLQSPEVKRAMGRAELRAEEKEAATAKG